MSKLKVISEKYNDRDILYVENFNEEVVKDIKADKDVISKIEMVYSKEDDTTSIYFPDNIIPLSITINAHQLYFKNPDLVDYRGQTVEGYSLVDYYSDDRHVELDIKGDVSEQVISELIYLPTSGTVSTLQNTYNLFYPEKVVKPIYYHPVFLNGLDNNGRIVRILFTILDNSATPYTVTSSITKIKQLMDIGGIIAVDGIVVDSNNKTSDVYQIKKVESVYFLHFFNYDERDEINIDNITWDECSDGVNKIN